MPGIKDPTNLQAHIDFATQLAKDTGLNFYTAYGWASAEDGPLDNPLGLGGGAQGSHAPTIKAAADAAAANLKAHPEWYSQLTATAVRKYPNMDEELTAEAHAIAISPWGQDPITKRTGAGPKPNYEANIAGAALKAIYEHIGPSSKVDPPIAGAPGGGTPGYSPDGPGDSADPLSAIGGFFSGITHLQIFNDPQEFFLRVGIGAVGIIIIAITAKKLVD